MKASCHPFTQRSSFPLPMALLAAVLTTASTSAARADNCDDQAAMLANHIEGLKVGAARAGVIALEHPAVSRASLGCSGRNITNEMFAAAKSNKPPPEFYDFIANAAALIFAIPKPDALRGAQRCTGRIGFIRGHNIETRYRRLDIRCTGSKTDMTISISREKNDNS